MKDVRPVTHMSRNGPEAIKQEIEQTRERMGDTIEEIKERLSPQHLKEQVKEAAAEKTKYMIGATAVHAREWSETIRQNMKGHPVWYAAGGVGAGGLVWLLSRRSHHDGRHEADSAQPVDRPTEYMHEQSTWNESANIVEQKTGAAKSRVPQKAPQKDQRNLLFLGAVAFVAGAIAGLMIPASTWEGEWARKVREVFGEAGENRL